MEERATDELPALRLRQAVSVINHQFPWELILLLANVWIYSNVDLTHMEGAIEAFSKICEDIPQVLDVENSGSSDVYSFLDYSSVFLKFSNSRGMSKDTRNCSAPKFARLRKASGKPPQFHQVRSCFLFRDRPPFRNSSVFRVSIRSSPPFPKQLLPNLSLPKVPNPSQYPHSDHPPLPLKGIDFNSGRPSSSKYGERSPTLKVACTP
ncbi:hypothetical protein LXL04_038745 [Taraxacum kok-saghyz]